MKFDQAFDRLLGREGGYSNNAADHGGETRYGITIAVARANGYAGDMKTLPIDFAKAIYRKSYWIPCHCDDLPDAVRYDVFDAAVNSGGRQSAKWLQRAVGVADDGVIGPVTLAAVASCPNVANKFNGQRLQFMTTLPNWPQFGKGWARRIADNLMGV